MSGKTDEEITSLLPIFLFLLYFLLSWTSNLEEHFLSVSVPAGGIVHKHSELTSQEGARLDMDCVECVAVNPQSECLHAFCPVHAGIDPKWRKRSRKNQKMMFERKKNVCVAQEPRRGLAERSQVRSLRGWLQVHHNITYK